MTDDPESPARPAGRTLSYAASGVLLTSAAVMSYLALRPVSPPADAGAHLTLTPAQLAAIVDAANARAAAGETDAAHAILDAAVREHPDDRPLRAALAESLLLCKRPAEAYDQYARILAQGGRDVRTELAAGTVASMAGLPEKALEHFASAQKLDPANADAPLFAAQMQIRLRNIDGAKANLIIAGSLDPERAAVWGTLADLALGENKLDLAKQHIRKAATLEPEQPAWRAIEARILKRAGDPSRALDLIMSLPAERRSDPALLAIAGECYGLLGRASEAAGLFRSASDANPTDGPGALRAAEWLRRAGDDAGALAYARRAAANGVPEGAAMVGALQGSPDR